MAEVSTPTLEISTSSSSSSSSSASSLPSLSASFFAALTAFFFSRRSSLFRSADSFSACFNFWVLLFASAEFGRGFLGFLKTQICLRNSRSYSVGNSLKWIIALKWPPSQRKQNIDKIPAKKSTYTSYPWIRRTSRISFSSVVALFLWYVASVASLNISKISNYRQ